MSRRAVVATVSGLVLAVGALTGCSGSGGAEEPAGPPSTGPMGAITNAEKAAEEAAKHEQEMQDSIREGVGQGEGVPSPESE